jgi:hypothetical protein
MRGRLRILRKQCNYSVDLKPTLRVCGDRPVNSKQDARCILEKKGKVRKIKRSKTLRKGCNTAVYMRLMSVLVLGDWLTLPAAPQSDHVCVCVIRFLCGSVADTTGSRRTLLTKSISHDRSQFKVHTDEPTQVHSAQPSLAVTHPSTNRDRRALTSMNLSPS